MPRREYHTASVTNVDDPEKRGRICVDCPTIAAGDELEWVDPMFPMVDTETSSGFFFVPSVGSMVEIEIEAESDSEANGLLPKWRTTLYPEGTFPSEFEDNYPKRFGWKTSEGHVFYFDNTENSLVFLYQHPSGTKIEVDNDGNITLDAPAGKSIFIGANATEPLVHGDLLKTFLTSLVSALGSHTHTGVTAGLASTGTSVGYPSVPGTLLSTYHKVL